jgi:hypothetical protein
VAAATFDRRHTDIMLAAMGFALKPGPVCWCCFSIGPLGLLTPSK